MKRFCFLILNVLFFIISVYANRITVNSIPVKNQFPSNSVYRILQDRDGFLWFGTFDGLCRYDGYRVIVFRSNLDYPNLLSSNEITCLDEDNDNRIWIGTKEGINILDRETFRITKFSNSIIQNQNIQSILCASDGSVWIAIDNIVYKYVAKTNTFKNVSENSIPKGGFGINQIFEDNFGDIWILIWENGIHRYRKDGSVINYPKIGDKNNPFRIYQDNKNQYWICSWGDGVYQFYPNNNQEMMYKKCLVYKKGSLSPEKAFYGIVQDNSLGYLWLMSFSGIYALQYEDENTISQIDVSYLFQGLNNIYSDIIKDRTGNLWVAAFDEGVFSINFDKADINNLKLDNIKNNIGVEPNITTIYKDNNILWLNQNRVGLCLYDLQTNQVKSYLEMSELIQQSDYFSNITCIEEASKNKLWMGIENQAKICVVDKNNGNIKLNAIIDLNVLHKGESVKGIRKIFKDSKNNIWVTTNRYVFIKPYNKENLELFSQDITDITNLTEDKNGSLWMSCASKGIYRIDFNFNTQVSDFKITNYNKSKDKLPSDNIVAVCSDFEGNVWMGTKEGNVIFYDVLKSVYEDFTRVSNIMNEAILDMIVDNNNNIWITTNKRIIVYNKKLGASRDYSTADGLIVNSFYKGSYYFDKSENTLYFGGNHGICRFPANSFVVEKVKNIKTVITDVKIGGISQLAIINNDKFKTISQKLILSPNDKNIEIDFTTLDYTSPGKIMYAYKMDGIDDDWVYTNRQFVTYNQLKKGKNLFYIRATDENRIWNSSISTFEIYKTPAFYETWWAYSLYILLFVALLYWTYRIVRNRIRLRQELKIAQIEKEKSEELTQTKLRYFTNISHELLTPLTIISCMIDDIETMTKQKVAQFGIMRANTNRLKRLLQQVLDFRKMESGNMKLRVTNGDISSFIRDICYNNFGPLLEKKKIQFLFESEPVQIFGYFDADKVDKIIYNLLSNALKYTPEGGEIKVCLKRLRQDNISSVSIVIKDSGVGILPEEISKIFTRFYNNKKIETGQTNGIGLSLTHDLVEIHYGKISVDSKLNEGSVFTVILPLDKSVFSETELDNGLIGVINDSDKNNMESNSQDIIELEEFPEKENVNLLLIEDNEDILYALKNILQKRYNILTATNGSIALNIIKDNDIDIIVSDVMMPEMDGLEFCRKIKSDINTSHIPVLLLTAKNSVEDRIECYDAGADGYISKPFDIKLLKSRINNFLTNRQEKQKEFKSNAEINISTLNYPSLDEEFLNKAVKIIEEHLADTSFDVDIFAEKMNMSKSSLYRKIKTMTGLPPNEFIRNIRLKHACLMLKDKAISISEVAYSVGFTDPRYFATCFKTEFEMTPTEYQKSQ